MICFKEYENTAVQLDEDEQSHLEGKRLKLLYTQLSVVRRVYTGDVREENEELLMVLTQNARGQETSAI